MVDKIAERQAELEAEEPYDTSDNKQVNKARKKAARTRAHRLEFIKAAMQHEEGRAWFYDIMNRCRVFGNPFCEEQTNTTAFRLGEQNIGKMILEDVQEAAPDMYMTMITEGRKR